MSLLNIHTRFLDATVGTEILVDALKGLQEELSKARDLDLIVATLEAKIAEADNRRANLPKWDHEQRIKLTGQIDGLLQARSLLAPISPPNPPVN